MSHAGVVTVTGAVAAEIREAFRACAEEWYVVRGFHGLSVNVEPVVEAILIPARGSL